MPESKSFIVTETREVRVAANSPLQAAQIAQMAFDGDPVDTGSSRAVGEALPGTWGYTHGAVRQKTIEAREGYK